jgi:ABC-type branched-subunit amino acid transport system ATPase component
MPKTVQIRDIDDDVYAALTEVVAAGDRAILLVEHNLDAAMRFVRNSGTAPQQTAA